MNKQPKPCPFCGWGTIVDEAFWLPNKHICKCNACGARTKIYPTWNDAVEAWNRRTEQTEPQTDCKTCSYGEVDEGYVRCAYYSKSNAIEDKPQYDFGEYADRLWKIAYERGKREALEQSKGVSDD